MRPRALLFAGLLSSTILLALAWWLSARWDVTLCTYSWSNPIAISIRRGRLEFGMPGQGVYQSSFKIYRIYPPRRGETNRDHVFSFHSGSRWWIAAVPLWVPVLTFGAPTVPWLAAKATRRLRGRCTRCGYPLRGLPAEINAVVCPECGKASKRVARAL